MNKEQTRKLTEAVSLLAHAVEISAIGSSPDRVHSKVRDCRCVLSEISASLDAGEQSDVDARRLGAVPDLIVAANMAISVLENPSVASLLEMSGFRTNRHDEAVSALKAAIAKAEGRDA